MPMSWDQNSPSLLPTMICYADILGFRNMTEQALKSGTAVEFLLRVKHSLAEAYGKVREDATLGDEIPPRFDMKVFTDNIVVAHPLGNPGRDLGEPELGTLLMLFAQVQAGLAADGFFLRGAVAAGWHYQDDDIAYGNALLEAVDLDKSGSPPRLVIASSVEPLILKHLSWYHGVRAPHHAVLLEDPSDGRLFVDYLRTAFANFPDGPVNWDLLGAHSKEVSEGLQKYKSDANVGPKYAWLATYHNYACRTFADRFRFRGDWEPDPEAVAANEEAQLALEHLVPLEARPDEQPPRPLDAQRLQQRLAITQT